MSLIIWCDIHNGPFSEREAGWAFIDMAIRKADGNNERKTLHACPPCVVKLIINPPRIQALETEQPEE